MTETEISDARMRNVRDQKSRISIATDMDIDISELTRLIEEEDWDSQRAAYEMNAAREREENPMADHVQLAASILRDIKSLRTRLMLDNTREEQAMLRSKVESLRSLAEAAAGTIKVMREAAGLKTGNASFGTTEEVQGVAYTVVLPKVAEAASQ
jgi:hypothetical protein